MPGTSQFIPLTDSKLRVVLEQMGQPVTTLIAPAGASAATPTAGPTATTTVADATTTSTQAVANSQGHLPDEPPLATADDTATGSDTDSTYVQELKYPEATDSASDDEDSDNDDQDQPSPVIIVPGGSLSHLEDCAQNDAATTLDEQILGIARNLRIKMFVPEAQDQDGHELSLSQDEIEEALDTSPERKTPRKGRLASQIGHPLHTQRRLDVDQTRTPAAAPQPPASAVTTATQTARPVVVAPITATTPAAVLPKITFQQPTVFFSGTGRGIQLGRGRGQIPSMDSSTPRRSRFPAPGAGIHTMPKGAAAPKQALTTTAAPTAR